MGWTHTTLRYFGEKFCPGQSEQIYSWQKSLFPMNQHFPGFKKKQTLNQNPSRPSLSHFYCSGRGGSWTQTHGRILGYELDEMGPPWKARPRPGGIFQTDGETKARPTSAGKSLSEGGGHIQREGVPAVLPTLPGPGGGEIQPLVNAGDAVPALCRAGLGYWAGAGKAPPQVTGGLRNSSPHSAPAEPQLIREL